MDNLDPTYIVALVVCLISCILVPVTGDAFVGRSSSPSFAKSAQSLLKSKSSLILRGGATSIEVEESDDDLEIEESDDDLEIESSDVEEEEEEKLDPKLAKSAQSSTVKAKAKVYTMALQQVPKHSAVPFDEHDELHDSLAGKFHRAIALGRDRKF